ncbi:hypothetical protein JUJ52_09900, partial [Virgibacillus sp. AGTR]|nr:hypothetical protein [Virgibacillus sp. AGTR]
EDSLESVSECGANGRPVRWAFKAEAGNKGFQPQSKPPVHTGGFDYSNSILHHYLLVFVVRM